jgi:hypothetical protein
MIEGLKPDPDGLLRHNHPHEAVILR